MAQSRIQLDSRSVHNMLMAQLCQQAAAGLARQIKLTKDPKRHDVLVRRIREHEEQSEIHRKIAEELDLNER